MYQPAGPVHVLLKSTIKVRVGLGGRSETHLFAKIVTTIPAFEARTAESASFNGNTITDSKRSRSGNVRSESDDLSSRLVTKAHGVLESKVSIATVKVVVQVGTAETSSSDADLHFVARRRSVGTLLDAKIFGAVKSGRGVGTERSGAVHGAVGFRGRCRSCDGF